MKLIVDGQEVGPEFFQNPQSGVHSLVIEETRDGRLFRQVIPRARLQWRPTFDELLRPTGLAFDIVILPNPQPAPRRTWWQRLGDRLAIWGRR